MPINVQVMPVGTMRFAGENELGGLGAIESRFDAIEYLPSRDTKEVQARMYADGQRQPRSAFDDWFHPRLPSAEEVTLEIRFDDVEGGRYRLRAIILAEQNTANLPRKVRLGPIEELAG
jgi:hypothetical protein